MKRCLAILWGLFPFVRLKGWFLWFLGPRFIVTVMAIVFDAEGRVLLFRHTHDSDSPWGLPSGRVEWHESPEAALHREVTEESGFEVFVGPIIAAYRDPLLPLVRIAYRCHIIAGAFRPSAEVVECQFFSLADLPSTRWTMQIEAIRQAAAARPTTAEL